MKRRRDSWAIDNFMEACDLVCKPIIEYYKGLKMIKQNIYWKHVKKNDFYCIQTLGEMKENGAWKEAVIYSPVVIFEPKGFDISVNNISSAGIKKTLTIEGKTLISDKKNYIRTVDDFLQKFKPAKKDEMEKYFQMNLNDYSNSFI